jgi:hypothetical protein
MKRFWWSIFTFLLSIYRNVSRFYLNIITLWFSQAAALPLFPLRYVQNFRGLRRGVPGCLFGISRSVAAFIRKRVRILLNDGKRIFFEYQNDKMANLPHHPNQLWYSNVLIECFRYKSVHFSVIKYLYTLSGLTAICLKYLTLANYNISKPIW